MLHFLKHHSFAVILLIFTYGCQSVVHQDNQHEDLITNSNHLSPVTKGFTKWHEQVIASKKAIDTNQSEISLSYNKIRDFDNQSMTSYWIDEVSTIIAKNSEYQQTITQEAKQDKYIFVQNLLKNPKQVTLFEGASNAFVDALNHIEGLDYRYRNLSNAFEDSARGRTHKTISEKRNINNVSLNIYRSRNNTPSVMEQMLTVAAVKILNLENDAKISKSYQKLLSNIPVENCLHRAQQNSAQCQAASYDKHDLSFCMAKHAIGETSQCFSWILP
jgi:hypothetical protein